MPRQAIEQGECTECGASDNNFTVENHVIGESGVGYKLSCQCGTEAIVGISENGIGPKENISHESASVNES